MSPDGATVAYGDDGWVWLVPLTGGPPRTARRGGEPGLARERPARRLGRARPLRPARRRLRRRRLAAAGCAASHGGLDVDGDEQEAIVSPDGSTVAYVFVPHADYSRYEIRVVDVATGSRPRAHRERPGSATTRSTGRPTAHDRDRLRADRMVRAPSRRRRRVGRATAHRRRGGLLRGAVASRTAASLVCTRGRAGRWDLVTVDADERRGDRACPRRDLGRAALDGRRSRRRHLRRSSHAARAACRRARAQSREPLHRPAPLAVRVAPYVLAEELTYATFDGREIQAFLHRPAGASAEHRAPVVVNPHGGPADCSGGDWDGHAQYFVDKGYGWLTFNYRGSTGHGSDFERLEPRLRGASTIRRTASQRPTSCAPSIGSTASASASSAPVTGRIWRCSR